uniref:Uncharacterized protein n=1 Tax=Candidatus Kentrum sp. TC TaxID=2126339 RepID=A0A451ACP5_9GAMM|nr:MAG: hypothetical protein BECKTC1821F_GA0114240_11073 [Candidatus Kentron sp. TC]
MVPSYLHSASPVVACRIQTEILNTFLSGLVNLFVDDLEKFTLSLIHVLS